MKYLFIGGHSDGRWIDLTSSPPRPVVRIPYPQAGGGCANDVYEHRGGKLSSADGGLFTVYAQGTSGTDVLAWLLHGYRHRAVTVDEEATASAVENGCDLLVLR